VCNKVENRLEQGKSVSVERLRIAANYCLKIYKSNIDLTYDNIHAALLQLYTFRRTFETTRPNAKYVEPKTVKLSHKQSPDRFPALLRRFTSSSRK